LFVIPDDLPVALTPFTFLVGNWRGTGVISYGDEASETDFSQTLTFRPLEDGRLEYRAESRAKDGRLIANEYGFWMLSRPAAESDSGPGLLPAKTLESLTREDLEKQRNERGGFDVEALMIQPSGIAELYFGQIKGARVDLATDAVLRSPNAREYTAGQRIFGLVEGALLWAWDIAALGNSLKSHASARLERVE
jgi:hypothetical protein